MKIVLTKLIAGLVFVSSFQANAMYRIQDHANTLADNATKIAQAIIDSPKYGEESNEYAQINQILGWLGNLQESIGTISQNNVGVNKTTIDQIVDRLNRLARKVKLENEIFQIKFSPIQRRRFNNIPVYDEAFDFNLLRSTRSRRTSASSSASYAADDESTSLTPRRRKLSEQSKPINKAPEPAHSDVPPRPATPFEPAHTAPPLPGTPAPNELDSDGYVYENQDVENGASQSARSSATSMSSDDAEIDGAATTTSESTDANGDNQGGFNDGSSSSDESTVDDEESSALDSSNDSTSSNGCTYTQQLCKLIQNKFVLTGGALAVAYYGYHYYTDSKAEEITVA